jgi:hypothetical protein
MRHPPYPQSAYDHKKNWCPLCGGREGGVTFHSTQSLRFYIIGGNE